MLEFLLSGHAGEKHLSVRSIVLSGLLLILGIVIATMLMIGSFRERSLASSKRELENAVLLLSRHFDQQLEDHVDAQARLSTQLGIGKIAKADDFKLKMATPAVQAMLSKEIEGLLSAKTISLYDSDGNIVTASGTEASAVDIAETTGFKSFRSDPKSATTLVEPIRDYGADRWTIMLTRKLINADGIFLGVMTRRIDPSRFDKFFESITLRNGAWIAMLHRDGHLLAQFPKLADGGNGQRVAANLRVLVSDSDSASSQLTDPDHHTVLLVSARAMRNFPIVLVATITSTAALLDWREQTKLLVVVASMLAIVIIAIFLLIGRRWKQEQKSAEERLAAGKQQLDTALASMTQGLCMVDTDERLVLCNASFREMYKLSEDQTGPGLAFSELASALAMSADAFAMSVAESGEQGVAHDQVRRLLDGRAVLVRRTPTPTGGWLQTHEDITDRERVASELASRLADHIKAQKKLEAQKSELIATTTALSEARDAAEAASRTKSDFLAMMSHEIRTPMAGMMGMIDLLNGTALNAEQQQLAKVAHESARNLLSVLNDILDFSKLEAGQLKPEAIEFNLEQAINGVISLMGPKANGQGLVLESSLPPDSAIWFRGDPSRIGQVMLNLVGNAIKFTERGFVRIVASHRELGGGNVEVHIEVIDSGTGIPEAVLPTLFSPFTQADISVSRKYGGTGLGLAICRQLCLMMGGDIGVESEPGRGSRFWFTVRCEIGEAPQLPAPSLQPDMAPDAADIDILVAEDNAVIRSLVMKLLARRGYDADQVTNGREAVDAVCARAYDLVLMDMQMPVLDGISATREIRALASPQRYVPIIALTANALVGQREECLAAGMTAFLTKPIQPDLLYEAIARWAPAPNDKAASPTRDDAASENSSAVVGLA
jgi:signal transduction histidine kinase/FixJ family two-component response regulator